MSSSFSLPDVSRLLRGARGRALLLLGVVLVLLLGILVFADKPWEVASAVAERELAGKSPLYKHDVVRGIYWAAAINAGLVLVLMATVGVWVRPMGAGRETAKVPEERRAVRLRVFLTWVVLFVVIGAGLRWNFARKGLWWDEMWSVKQVIVGKYDVEEDGTRGAFQASTAGRTLWSYHKPTNHTAASYLAYLSHRVWRGTFGKGAEAHEFSELAIRLPNLLVSLLGIFWMAWWLRSWGSSYGGMAAAGFLAVHPWVVRYGVDARAYSLVVVLTLAACVALTAIYRSRAGSWWPWLGFGLSLFLLVWTFMASIWLAGCLFLGGVILICLRWRDGASRVAGLLRLGVVSGLAGMAFLQVFLPNLMQMQRWFSKLRETHRHLLDEDLFLVIVTGVTLGMPRLIGGGEGAAGIPSVAGMAGAQPILFWGLVALLLVVLMMGLRALASRMGLAVALGAVLAGGAVHLGFSLVAEQFIYQRFVIYAVVPGVAVGGWGAGRVGEIFGERFGRWGGLLGFSLPVWVYVALVWPQLWLLQTRPYSPSTEITDFFNGKDMAEPGGIVAVGYGLGGEVQRVYLPDVRHAVSRADVERYAAEAKKAGKALYLFYGYESFNRATLGDGFELIDDDDLFREVAAFSGIEAEFYFRVMEYRGDG
jgi:hypothetical protein